MIRCSILGLKPANLCCYARAIQHHRVEYFHGYPSALFLLASEILAAGFSFPQPKAILLASEIVHDFQLMRISEAFPNAKLFAHYGCAERTVLAGWCEHRRQYHVLPQYSLVEIDAASAEVIGTNLYNSVNGFVRYRMTDTVLRETTNGGCECGRPYVLLSAIGGRAEEYLFSTVHGWIAPAIITYPLKSLKAIHELQFVQEEIQSIRLRYSVSNVIGMSLETERRHVEQGMRKLLGPDIRCLWERVDSFERGPTGKFKWIICNLAEQPGRKA